MPKQHLRHVILKSQVQKGKMCCPHSGVCMLGGGARRDKARGCHSLAAGQPEPTFCSAALAQWPEIRHHRFSVPASPARIPLGDKNVGASPASLRTQTLVVAAPWRSRAVHVGKRTRRWFCQPLFWLRRPSPIFKSGGSRSLHTTPNRLLHDTILLLFIGSILHSGSLKRYDSSK